MLLAQRLGERGHDVEHSAAWEPEKTRQPVIGNQIGEKVCFRERRDLRVRNQETLQQRRAGSRAANQKHALPNAGIGMALSLGRW